MWTEGLGGARLGLEEEVPGLQVAAMQEEEVQGLETELELEVRGQQHTAGCGAGGPGPGAREPGSPGEPGELGPLLPLAGINTGSGLWEGLSLREQLKRAILTIAKYVFSVGQAGKENGITFVSIPAAERCFQTE